MARKLCIAATPDDLAREAAERFVAAAQTAIAARGSFAVALSGGSTPQRLFTLLTQAPYAQGVDWSRVRVFFADERFVPPHHPDSNFRLARETLLDHVPVAPDNVFPMPTEGATPEQCAAAYGATLAAVFGAPLPHFDLVLLGMGPDGHTASLFPGRPDYPGAVAAVHDSPKPPPLRLTLTLAAINRAREIHFLVTGADKADALRAVFEDDATLPATRVAADSGSTLWLVDRAAGRWVEAFASARRGD